MDIGKIKVGIVGYGNLGKGTEIAIASCPDMELVGVFTRRNPDGLKFLSESTVGYHVDNLTAMKNYIDVLIICGGSATDLPEMTPRFAEDFNVIDSFDNHGRIPQHFEAVNAAAIKGGKVAIISVGWDPGLFSLQRVLAGAVLPQGNSYTFWGKGVSQGHSDAIRRIEGVADARQYTVPMQSALDKVYLGDGPILSSGEKHTRLCYVVLKSGGEQEKIRQAIVSMPNYFADYTTIVNFITQEELDRDHSGLPHGGVVIHSGKTGVNGENLQLSEYKLKLDSNPQFTASVLVAYSRSAVRLAREGQVGCKTVLDIPPAYLSQQSGEELRKTLL